MLGSGAREHSIIKAIDRSSKPNEIFCIASNMNPGIANLCNEFIIDDFNNTEIVTKYATERNITLAIIGPENPLQKGVADALWNAKIKVVGPKKELAQIETSKAFTRNLLKKHKHLDQVTTKVLEINPDHKIIKNLSVLDFTNEKNKSKCAEVSDMPWAPARHVFFRPEPPHMPRIPASASRTTQQAIELAT